MCCLTVAGCGGMRRQSGEGPARIYRYGIPSESRIPVAAGKMTSSAGIDHDVSDAVCRYLIDQTAAALAHHDLFILVDEKPVHADTIPGGLQRDGGGEILTASAAVDVEVLAIHEKTGGTVKVGIVSKQNKYAKVTLRATLNMKDSGRRYESVCTAKSAKGAWGVVTMVDRQTMLEGKGVWKLDDSMVGHACAEAVRKCIRDIAVRIERSPP
jgi:hypothetical protein